MKHIFWILSLLIPLLMYSCGRISNKGRELYDGAKHMAKDQAKATIDKVVPQFDPYIADSKFNRRRFEDYLQLKPGDSARNIYAYGDFLGIDYHVMLAFECDPSFAQKIIRTNELVLSAETDRKNLSYGTSFDWWPKEQLDALPQFIKGEDYKYYKILWVDSSAQKAYYLEFSL